MPIHDSIEGGNRIKNPEQSAIPQTSEQLSWEAKAPSQRKDGGIYNFSQSPGDLPRCSPRRRNIRSEDNLRDGKPEPADIPRIRKHQSSNPEIGNDSDNERRTPKRSRKHDLT